MWGKAMKVEKSIGAQRVAQMDQRVAVMKAAATPTPIASPVIIPAPARGPTKVVQMCETVATENGPRVRRTTVDGFHPVQASDAFDQMELQARRRDAQGKPLFTRHQVDAGRAYAALDERCASEGVRCSSVEAGRGGVPGGQRDWIDGVIQRSDALARMHAAIGDGVALSPRGAEAHADRGRQVVRARDLVDAVCIHGKTLSQVLKAKGWHPDGRTLPVARAALCAALDRMVE
jgi:hypothetical protein